MDSGIIETVKEYLIRNVGGQSEELDVLVRDSSVRVRDIMDVLDDAIDDGEFDTAVSSAGELKVNLQNLGLEELSIVANNIETAAGSSTPFHLSCYYMRLRRELAAFLDYGR